MFQQVACRLRTSCFRSSSNIILFRVTIQQSANVHFCSKRKKLLNFCSSSFNTLSNKSSHGYFSSLRQASSSIAGNRFENSISEPEFDWSYLSNAENTEMIRQNIANRKGVGDIDTVVSHLKL